MTERSVSLVTWTALRNQELKLQMPMTLGQSLSQRQRHLLQMHQQQFSPSQQQLKHLIKHLIKSVLELLRKLANTGKASSRQQTPSKGLYAQ